MPAETKKELEVIMRYNLIAFISELTLQTQRKNKELSKLKEKVWHRTHQSYM